MNASETFQISLAQAEVYEQRFVPAIFGQWAAPLLDTAAVAPGDSVLDVACGTGALARAASQRVGPAGRVVGLDINEGMLGVARRLRPDIEWRLGDAADLPFDADAFDAVLCQSALMFFPDPTQALREMRRVCRPGGTVAVQVYAGLDAQPAYGPWTTMVARLAGPDAASLLGTYWAHGDPDVLSSRFSAAGLEVREVRTVPGVARWASVDEMVEVEVGASPLAGRIGTPVYERIVQESRSVLGPHVTSTAAEIPLVALLVVARKP